ncbi:MAG: PfkB family carbohydrate kinase [Salinivirgaceae bacterium]|jgi:fructokinase|nr:PfkB family carbohydrate kinase [Salinivirgaceae bacterium]
MVDKPIVFKFVHHYLMLFMIYTIGETVLDIIFKTIEDVKVKPGGSMLNTAVSLGRLDLKTGHVSTLSDDKASGLLIDFLERCGVSCQYIYRSNRIKTSLALAYLNEYNNAEYTFYKDDLNLKDGLVFPKISDSDIVHYGSFFSINRNVHNQLHAFLSKAKANGAITIYDPNFRTPHLPMLQLLLPLIEKNIVAADIVKGSDEDFKNIFACNSGKKTWEMLKDKGVKVLFYTKGADGSEVHTNKGTVESKAPKIEVVSTIGAGDTYSAGIIYFLTKYGCNLAELDKVELDDWKKCIEMATEFSAQTCQSMDNYLSEEYCKNLTDV